MSQNSDLFNLIKSLSKAEKRAFKIKAQQNERTGSSNYSLLFDFLDKMDEYKEALVLKYFEGEIFAKKLSVTKSLLYKLILKTLHEFHYELDINAQINNLLTYSKLLQNKNLLHQSLKALKKAKKIAECNNRFLKILEINQAEQAIHRKAINLKALKQNLNSQLKDSELFCGNYIKDIQYECLSDEMLTILEQKGPQKKKSPKRIQEIMQHPLLKSEPPKYSHESYINYNLIHMDYAYFRKDYVNAKLHNDKILKYFVENDSLINDKTSQYISSLHTAVVINKALKDYAGAFDIIETLKELENKASIDVANKAKAFTIHCYHEIHLQITLNQFDTFGDLIVRFERGYNLYKGKIETPFLAFYYYRISQIYFLLDEKPIALDWLNKLLSLPLSKVREDLLVVAKILNLIIHFDLGNDLLLNNIIDSNIKFIARKDRLYATEILILEFIKKHLFQEDADLFKQGLQNLKASIIKNKNNTQSMLLDYFDISSWIESKIQKKSIKEILET